MSAKDNQLWFDDIPVLAKLPRGEAAAKLREMGDTETAELLERKGIMAPRGLPRPWQHTSHAFGHIPLLDLNSTQPVDITHAGSMPPDDRLKGSRIKIVLNQLRVANYPGKGVHHILFDFYAQNQIRHRVERLHFNQTYRAQQGQQVGIIGYPIFIGLSVGSEGVSFKCHTVNVKNDNDEAILNVLDSDIMRGGLKLATTAQPAIAPLADLALGLTKMIASRHKNVSVQDFYMGLDFEKVPGGARLAEGAYVAVQIPETDEVGWNWREWVYDPNSGRIVDRKDRKSLIPYNYIVIGVSKYEGD